MDPNDCCTRTDRPADDRSALERAILDADRALTDTRTLWRTTLALGNEHPDSARTDAALCAIADAEQGLADALRNLNALTDTDVPF